MCVAGTLCVDRTPRTALLIVNSDIRELGCGPQHMTLDPQLRSMLQWVAASMTDIPYIQLSPDKELKQVIDHRSCLLLFTVISFIESFTSVKEVISSLIADIWFYSLACCGDKTNS